MAFTGEASFALVDWSRGIIGLRFTLFFPLTSSLCFSCCGWAPTYSHHIAVGCFLNPKHRKESTPDDLQVLLTSPVSASEPFRRTLSRQTLDIYFTVRQFALWMCPFLHFDCRRRGCEKFRLKCLHFRLIRPRSRFPSSPLPLSPGLHLPRVFRRAMVGEILAHSHINAFKTSTVF